MRRQISGKLMQNPTRVRGPKFGFRGPVSRSGQEAGDLETGTWRFGGSNSRKSINQVRARRV
ncbi:Hypothetical protein DEACI_0217 [Acididesulfobacillus acetoxydans]|uniref:Uncharacterized protein n=1 Tax=Acididesulfobacillus acetoxydans TaxID=1561005 RepID=A0A8S0WVH4_9FIRM|nr:hypothetical protein [Acididesulfobacillus acetoxydans]CAA7599591.1 Hypothetical protein DEACI_0217 [Acididesulfobacillus acetoxydans]CEJ07786.1 Hypothetical protein DEACI_2252 [Acididesulfobacillus acetoxydans]